MAAIKIDLQYFSHLKIIFSAYYQSYISESVVNLKKLNILQQKYAVKSIYSFNITNSVTKSSCSPQM